MRTNEAEGIIGGILIAAEYLCNTGKSVDGHIQTSHHCARLRMTIAITALLTISIVANIPRKIMLRIQQKEGKALTSKLLRQNKK